MSPITFHRTQRLPHPPAAICAAIADTSRWSEFGGYAFLPGIASAEYESRPAEMVGARIRVRNTDGSTHVEQITRWEAGQAVSMKMSEFTPPLSQLAAYFIEDWRFQPDGAGTLVTRTIQMFPARPAARPLLWLISLVFRQAIARDLARMAAA